MPKGPQGKRRILRRGVPCLLRSVFTAAFKPQYSVVKMQEGVVAFHWGLVAVLHIRNLRIGGMWQNGVV